MKYLIVDGCSSKSYISVVEENVVLLKKSFEGKSCTETLFTTLEFIFEKHSLDSFNFLAICIGPGSFTSSRVTLMCIKTLAFVKNIPIIPFDSHIPLRSSNFENESILNNLTKSGATLSTGGKAPKFISMKDLDISPPANLVQAPPYNMQALMHYLEQEQSLLQYAEPLTLTPLYLKNP